MAKKIVISAECIGCGLCFASPYIEEKSDGMASVKGTGILKDEDESDFKEVVDGCPRGAISLEQAEAKQRADIITRMSDEAVQFELTPPPREDYSFKESYNIRVGTIETSDMGRFSSERSARNAVSERIKPLLENRESVIRSILNEYRVEKFGPFCDFIESEDNFYYASNMKAQKVLDGWLSELEVSYPNMQIPDTLKSVWVFPNFNKNVYVEFLKETIMYRSRFVMSRIPSEQDDPDYYAQFCEMNTFSISGSMGLFGGYKTNTKYTPGSTSQCVKEIRGELTEAFNGAKEEIADEAYKDIQCIARDYGVKLRKDLKSKAEALISLIYDNI